MQITNQDILTILKKNDFLGLFDFSGAESLDINSLYHFLGRITHIYDDLQLSYDFFKESITKETDETIDTTEVENMLIKIDLYLNKPQFLN